MKIVAARMTLLGLATLALYALALLLIDHLSGADIRSPLPVWWSGAFAVAVAFAAWNVWDDLLDVRAALRRGRAARIIAGGFWRFRSDALQGSCCTAMAGAGVLAILQWGTPEARAALILGASVLLIVNQVWNRLDRERITRMPATPVMEHLAATAGRELYHALADDMQIPVAALDDFARDDRLPEDVRSRAAEGLAYLDQAMEQARRLHREIRRLGGAP